MSKYNQEQIRYLLSKSLERPYQFADFMNDMEQDMDEVIVYRNIRRLLLKIYQLNLSKKYLTKSQACSYIPSSNAKSCYKYVQRAKSLGYVDFKRSKEDKRRVFVVPKNDLLEYVENELDKEGDAIREEFSGILTRGDFPDDNVAYNGLAAKDISQ